MLDVYPKLGERKRDIRRQSKRSCFNTQGMFTGMAHGFVTLLLFYSFAPFICSHLLFPCFLSSIILLQTHTHQLHMQAPVCSSLQSVCLIATCFGFKLTLTSKATLDEMFSGCTLSASPASALCLCSSSYTYILIKSVLSSLQPPGQTLWKQWSRGRSVVRAGHPAAAAVVHREASVFLLLPPSDRRIA